MIKYITAFLITSLKWTACAFLVLGVVGIVADIDLIVCQPFSFIPFIFPICSEVSHMSDCMHKDRLLKVYSNYD